MFLLLCQAFARNYSIEQLDMLLLSRQRIVISELYCLDRRLQKLQVLKLNKPANLTYHEYLLLFSLIPVCNSSLTADFSYKSKNYVFKKIVVTAPESVAVNLSTIFVEMQLFENLQRSIQLMTMDDSDVARQLTNIQRLKQLIDLTLLMYDEQKLRDLRVLLLNYTLQSSFNNYLTSFVYLLNPLDNYQKYLLYNLLKIQFSQEFPQLLAINDSTDDTLVALASVFPQDAFFTVIDAENDFKALLAIENIDFSELSTGFYQMSFGRFAAADWNSFGSEKKEFVRKNYENGLKGFSPSLQKKMIYEVELKCLELRIEGGGVAGRRGEALAELKGEMIYNTYEILFYNFNDALYKKCACLYYDQQIEQITVNISAFKQQSTNIELQFTFLTTEATVYVNYCYLYTTYTFIHIFIHIPLQFHIDLHTHYDLFCKQLATYNIIDNKYLSVKLHLPGTPEYNVMVYAKETNQIVNLRITQELDIIEIYDLKQSFSGSILVFEQIEDVHINVITLQIERANIKNLNNEIQIYNNIQFNRGVSSDNQQDSSQTSVNQTISEQNEVINEQIKELNYLYLKIFIPIMICIFMLSLMITAIQFVLLKKKYSKYSLYDLTKKKE